MRVRLYRASGFGRGAAEGRLTGGAGLEPVDAGPVTVDGRPVVGHEVLAA